jgi:hypothetical protein
MSWIKENKFIASVAGITSVGVIVLLFVGSLGSKRYDAAQEKFEGAYAEAAGFEKKPLYPKVENQTSKVKALGEYRQAFDSLQTSFEPFRPTEIKNTKPQEFADQLIATNNEIRKAFGESATIVPEEFFVGFEKYNTSLAAANSTGILQYQLGAIKKVMLAMASAKVGELKNFYRSPIPEESGQVYTPTDSTVARSFPMEVTFSGTEQSVREFISSITKVDSQYFVIRVLRCGSSKKAPPLASDAQFEKAKEDKLATPPDAFPGGYTLPDETPAGSTEPKSPQDLTAPKPVDSSRILAQVLGTEPVQVFIRLDLLEFLPAKKLP